MTEQPSPELGINSLLQIRELHDKHLGRLTGLWGLRRLAWDQIKDSKFSPLPNVCRARNACGDQCRRRYPEQKALPSVGDRAVHESNKSANSEEDHNANRPSGKNSSFGIFKNR